MNNKHIICVGIIKITKLLFGTTKQNELFQFLDHHNYTAIKVEKSLKNLSANPTKWSNTHKKLVLYGDLKTRIAFPEKSIKVIYKRGRNLKEIMSSATFPFKKSNFKVRQQL